MAQRRSKRGFVDELFDLLVQVPIWVGPVLAAIVFVVLRWILPAAFAAGSGENEISRGGMNVFAKMAHGSAPWALLLTLMIWAAAEFKKFATRRTFDRQTGAESIRSLSWREFEELLAEAFRRQGFSVEHCGAAGPDGGVDLRLSKAGEATIVQCKHWQARQVGVRVVRELRGVIASEGVQSGIIITSGSFTPDARDFAATNPVRLIDGSELTSMIGRVQKSGRIVGGAAEVPATTPRASRPRASTPTVSPRPSTPVEPPCPRCSSAMVRRVAKRGANAGSEFFGCSRYPACRGTLPALPQR